MQRCKRPRFDPWVDNIPWRRVLQPTPVFLPGKSHGQGSLVGYSLWDRKGSDTTEQLHFHFSLSCIGEGNGNPLQCSCLENPRDREAWWAAVYGVTQSRTWLTRLSSSSSSSSSLQNCERVSFCSKPPDLRLYFRKLIHLGAGDSTCHWSDTVICLVTHEGNIILASLLSFLQTLSSSSDSDCTPPALCGRSMSQRWFPELLLSWGTTSHLSGRRGRVPLSKGMRIWQKTGG